MGVDSSKLFGDEPILKMPGLQKLFGDKSSDTCHLKIVLRGKEGVGKTSLFRVFQSHGIPEEHIPSKSSKSAILSWTIPETSEKVKIELWDIVDRDPGLQKSSKNRIATLLERAKKPNFNGSAMLEGIYPYNLSVYEGCNACIFIVDPRQLDSLDYVRDNIDYVPPSVPIAFLANFRDDIENWKMSQKQLQEFVKDLSTTHHLASHTRFGRLQKNILSCANNPSTTSSAGTSDPSRTSQPSERVDISIGEDLLQKQDSFEDDLLRFSPRDWPVDDPSCEVTADDSVKKSQSPSSPTTLFMKETSDNMGDAMARLDELNVVSTHKAGPAHHILDQDSIMSAIEWDELCGRPSLTLESQSNGLDDDVYNDGDFGGGADADADADDDDDDEQASVVYNQESEVSVESESTIDFNLGNEDADRVSDLNALSSLTDINARRVLRSEDLKAVLSKNNLYIGSQKCRCSVYRRDVTYIETSFKMLFGLRALYLFLSVPLYRLKISILENQLKLMNDELVESRRQFAVHNASATFESFLERMKAIEEQRLKQVNESSVSTTHPPSSSTSSEAVNTSVQTTRGRSSSDVRMDDNSAANANSKGTVPSTTDRLSTSSMSHGESGPPSVADLGKAAKNYLNAKITGIFSSKAPKETGASLPSSSSSAATQAPPSGSASALASATTQSQSQSQSQSQQQQGPTPHSSLGVIKNASNALSKFKKGTAEETIDNNIGSDKELDIVKTSGNAWYSSVLEDRIFDEQDLNRNMAASITSESLVRLVHEELAQDDLNYANEALDPDVCITTSPARSTRSSSRDVMLSDGIREVSPHSDSAVIQTANDYHKDGLF